MENRKLISFTKTNFKTLNELYLEANLLEQEISMSEWNIKSKTSSFIGGGGGGGDSHPRQWNLLKIISLCFSAYKGYKFVSNIIRKFRSKHF